MNWCLNCPQCLETPKPPLGELAARQLFPNDRTLEQNIGDRIPEVCPQMYHTHIIDGAGRANFLSVTVSIDKYVSSIGGWHHEAGF